ncbi:FadR family transcriptional regulator [Sinorhizobium meliloti]|nr:GntR family transcriptional regulator [Sinorhizobium meliloti RU11/001]RVG95650.1 FadR family transcriptional regulator [Sinorhizobium meliloti]RVH61227.1 FadR family transcriptional regulator [Sinorhizobium meliloti]RVL98496.1 FadR family transcriptional regulator [Sinorhizobium meliloti]RVN59639.1 FadR family transcriptional regulator [Sinorhizobium meliloti]
MWCLLVIPVGTICMNPVLSDSADELAGTEKVLSFFREQLLSGALKVGDRLLGERELCLALGVSRPVLREALRSLANLGFLDIRHGKGAFVRKADVGVFGDFLTFCLAQQPDMLDDIMQARVAIECQAIRLACIRATDSDLSHIGGLLTRLMDTLHNAEDGGAADFAFHMAIVEASRSPALVAVYRSISDLLKRSHVQRRAETSDAPGITDYLVEAHREVFLSILARDPDKADRMLREHFAIGDELRRKSYIAAFTRKGAPQEEEKEADS